MDGNDTGRWLGAQMQGRDWIFLGRHIWERSKVKTVFDKKIADCQVLLNFLNKFNAHKILCGGYYYSFHCIDEKSKGQR